MKGVLHGAGTLQLHTLTSEVSLALPEHHTSLNRCRQLSPLNLHPPPCLPLQVAICLSKSVLSASEEVPSEPFASRQGCLPSSML